MPCAWCWDQTTTATTTFRRSAWLFTTFSPCPLSFVPCPLSCFPLPKQVAPFVGGAGYLGALFVQQALPELFIFAYPLAVAVFAAPIAFIVLAT